MQDSTLKEWLDRAAILRVVQDWGLARDAGRWDQLRACYTEDGVMHTTWFVGYAAEFVERCTAAAKAGASVVHFLGATTIALNGDRAISENRVILTPRNRLDGIEVDVTCYGRFHDRFVRRDGQWRILKRVPVYEKDRIDVVEPGVTLKLDQSLLASLPHGCRHLTYVQSRSGMTISPNIAVPGSEALERLEAESREWLAQG